MIFFYLAGGIGKNLVKKLTTLGCIVICVDNNKENLIALKEEIAQNSNNSNRTYFYEEDISKIENIRKLKMSIRNEIGIVDIIINNAAIMNKAKLLLELSDEEIENIFNVNLFSQIWICREFLSDMIAQNKGHIVNMSSTLGLFGAYKLTDYCTTKFAVNGFTEALRVELKTLNSDNKIEVSLVTPFHVKTKLFNNYELPYFKW